MANRVREMGMDRALAGKMAAKYDAEIDREIRGWIHHLTGVDIGEGSANAERSLHDGQLLLKFAEKLKGGSSNLPPACANYKFKINTMSAPFKQMENIEVFLKFCELYGVQRTSLFPVVALYEGRNMPAFQACMLQLGTEAQRNMFNGPAIGPKPTEKHIVEFTEEQLKAGQSIIGLQAGSNKGASQSGMRTGPRHIADIKVDAGCAEGQAVIGLQAGTNQCASQAGMNLGGQRHIADIKVDAGCQEGQSVIGLQSGTNKGASQSGMSMGGQRHIADLKVDEASPDGQAIIGLQMGSNKGASQRGMNMGNTRHIVD